MKLSEIASMGATASGAIATAPAAPNMKDIVKQSGVTEELGTGDRTGDTCERCGWGKYKETGIQDDMQGVLHCTNPQCRMEVDRYGSEYGLDDLEEDLNGLLLRR